MPCDARYWSWTCGSYVASRTTWFHNHCPHFWCLSGFVRLYLSLVFSTAELCAAQMGFPSCLPKFLYVFLIAPQALACNLTRDSATSRIFIGWEWIYGCLPTPGGDGSCHRQCTAIWQGVHASFGCCIQDFIAFCRSGVVLSDLGRYIFFPLLHHPPSDSVLVRPDNTAALFVIMGVIGVCSLPMLAIGMELACEVTRNADGSAAIIWFSCVFNLTDHIKRYVLMYFIKREPFRCCFCPEWVWRAKAHDE